MTLLAVGLGNPGERFAGTRHNVGFDVVQAAADSLGISFRKPFFSRFEWTGRRSSGVPILARPLTFMNRSGTVFPGLLRRARADVGSLVVVCDNLDLPPGAVRLKRRGSARSHNGLASIMDSLGSGDFARIYLGIGRPEAGSTVVDHVLAAPPEAERGAYVAAVTLAAWAIEALMHDSIEAVMAELNRRQ